MYIQQAEAITVENNYFGSEIRIMDSRSIIIRNNDFQNLKIVDFDSPTYDFNRSQFRGSKDITISNNRIDTALGGVQLVDGSRDTAIEIILHNNLANMPKDIEISANQIACFRSFIVMKEMSANTRDYIADLLIFNNSVIKTSAFTNQGIIELRNNSDTPKHGLDYCIITGNYIAKASVSNDRLPWDVLITDSSPTSLILVDRTNRFNNLGVKIGEQKIL
jgi:hypothetical protein